MEAYKFDEKQHYTYADLLSWETKAGERWELIEGVAYMMASPSTAHQELLLELAGQFREQFAGKSCRPYIAPLEVRLFPREDNSDGDYVEPDLFVVCDSTKMSDRGCKGAPDLIVEILSPSTRSIDLLLKYNRYRDAGVKEYWIVDPDGEVLQAFTMKDGEYIARSYGAGDGKLESAALPGCFIDLTALFSSPRAP